MILLPENQWFATPTLAEAGYYTVETQSTYTLEITGVSEDAEIKWYEGGYRDETKVDAEMRWYELKSHTGPTLLIQSDNDKFHYVEVDGVIQGYIFIKVLPYDRLCSVHQCKGEYGPWCKACGAECYVEDGPPELPSAETPYRPGPDLSNEQGVTHGYSEPDSVPIKESRLDLRSIIIKAQNILKLWAESTFLDKMLNPTVDNTDQVDELFQIYGLDIKTPEGQDQFHELQIFEKTNSAEAANTKEKVALLEPFNDALCCLQNEINTYKPIVWARAPHVFFNKLNFVTIYGEEDTIAGCIENYIAKASAYEGTVIHTPAGESEYEEFINAIRCQGVLLRTPRYRDELVPVMIVGVIKCSNGTNPDSRLWLGEFGGYSESVIHPTPEHNTIVYQEIGHGSEDGFSFNPQSPITRYYTAEPGLG